MKKKIPAAFFFKYLFVAVFLALCVSVSFVSCSCSKELNGIYVNPEDIMLIISEKEPFDRLSKGLIITGSDLGKGYADSFLEKNFSSFSSSIFSGFAIYPSTFSDSPFEYGIFRLSSEKYSGNAADMLLKRLEHLRTDFSGSKSSLDIIDNAEIRKSGLYIYYAVTNINERVLTEIENTLVNMID